MWNIICRVRSDLGSSLQRVVGGRQNEQKRKGQKRGAELVGSPLFSRDSTDSAGMSRQGQVPVNTHTHQSKQEAAHTRAQLNGLYLHTESN